VRHTRLLRSLMDLLAHVFVRLGSRLDLASAHEGRVIAVGLEVLAELQVFVRAAPLVNEWALSPSRPLRPSHRDPAGE
jgi:hypothetical protein